MLSISSRLHKSNDPHPSVPFSHHRAIDTQSLQASFFSLTPRLKCSHVTLREMVWIWFGWCVACCLFWSVSVWHHKHSKVNDLKTEQNSETGLCIHQDFCLSQMQHILVLGHYHGQKQEPTARNFVASSLRKIVGISRASFHGCSPTATAPPPWRLYGWVFLKRSLACLLPPQEGDGVEEVPSLKSSWRLMMHNCLVLEAGFSSCRTTRSSWSTSFFTAFMFF